MQPDDLKWFWAAYRMGAMDKELQEFGLTVGMNLDDLNQKEFQTVLTAWNEASSFFVLVAKTPRGNAPVGVVAENREAHIMTPHVLWFPWGSDRNKFEAAMAFVAEMRREVMVVIYARLSDHRFWALLADYGVLKLRTKQGGIPEWYGDDAGEIWTGK